MKIQTTSLGICVTMIVKTLSAGMVLNKHQNSVKVRCHLVEMMATYDHTKVLCRDDWQIFEDGVFLHVIASFVAAVAATLMCQPFDTVKSRVMVRNITFIGLRVK